MTPKHSYLKLGVNIDHIATIREVRKTHYPDLVQAVALIEASGADTITLHLREDRRHIQDTDVFKLRDRLTTAMNLEMAPTPEMQQIALQIRPKACCLVPERREELTTEGGLDVITHAQMLQQYCAGLLDAGIEVSLFIEPDPLHIEAAVRIGVPVVELHTGNYANAATETERYIQLEKLKTSTHYAHTRGLIVNAGHGLDYENVSDVATIAGLNELNIGHSIVAYALFHGLAKAVSDMRGLLDQVRAA